MDERMITLFAALVNNTDRIARALEQLAMSNAKEPNFSKPIESYRDFDFETIGATIKARDEHGATALEWGGFIWTRRSPQNKFGEAIWFSRPLGKKEDGSVDYARLITFRKFTEAEPLPRKVEAIIESAPRRVDSQPVAQSPAGLEHLPPKVTDAPDYCHIHLCVMPQNSVGYYTHTIDGKLCDGTDMLNSESPDTCALHVVTMTEKSTTGVLFHRIKDTSGATTHYCNGTTVSPNGSKK